MMDSLGRFRSKIDFTDSCWLWTGAMHDAGYGMVRISKRLYRAHRVAYEFFIGPIPGGLDIDHLCRNRACVNPLHLEPVTRRENLRRGRTNMAKTHCSHGHAFDEANTRLYDGRRKCRKCERDRSRRRYRAA